MWLDAQDKLEFTLFVPLDVWMSVTQNGLDHWLIKATYVCQVNIHFSCFTCVSVSKILQLAPKLHHVLGSCVFFSNKCCITILHGWNCYNSVGMQNIPADKLSTLHRHAENYRDRWIFRNTMSCFTIPSAVYRSMQHKKATIHQLTTMLATSKNVLFPGHNHLLTTGADDPTL